MKLTFEKENHRYYLDGRYIPPLSQILDFYFGSFGWNNYEKMILEYLYQQKPKWNINFIDSEIKRIEGNKDAADQGARVHRACELFVKGELDTNSLKTPDDDLTGYIEAFKRFLKDHPGLATGKPTTEYKTYTCAQEEDVYCTLQDDWIIRMYVGMRIDLIFRQSRVVVEIKSGIPTKKHFFGFTREEMQLNTQIKAMGSKKKKADSWTGFLLYLKDNGDYRAIEKKFDYNLWYHFCAATNGWYNKNYKGE
jgi:hypothetical protein